MSASDESASAAETVEEAAVAVVEAVERHTTAVVGLSFVFAFLLALLLGIIEFEKAAHMAGYVGFVLIFVEAALYMRRSAERRASR